MKPAPVGTRVRVSRCIHNHSYRIGGIYTISEIDDDGTFKATDSCGCTGNWLRWDECELAGPSVWDRIATDLPEDLVAFLSCFDGIAELALKEAVVDTALASVPDLHERVVALARSKDGAPLIADSRPQPCKEKPTA